MEASRRDTVRCSPSSDRQLLVWPTERRPPLLRCESRCRATIAAGPCVFVGCQILGVASGLFEESSYSAGRGKHITRAVGNTGYLLQMMPKVWMTFLHIVEIGVPPRQAMLSFGLSHTLTIELFCMLV